MVLYLLNNKNYYQTKTKPIMRNVKTITKVLLTAVLFATISLNVSAQTAQKLDKVVEQVKRPDAVGHAATDNYVTSAFNLYEKNQELTKKLSDIKSHITEVKSIKNELLSQQKEVAGLLEKSADVINEAKTITPKTNSLKAVKAVNQANKALNETKNALPAQIEQIKTQTVG